MTPCLSRQSALVWALALLILLPSCASSVLISSSPSQARVYLDGRYAGQTPLRHRDAKPTGSKLEVRLEKEGHAPLTTEIVKDARVNVWAAMGSVLVIPLAWLLKYPRRVDFAMMPLTADGSSIVVEVQTKEAVGANIFVVALDNAPCHGASASSILEAGVGIRLMGKYQVLERQALDVVSSEHYRNMTGLHDESSIVDAGKLSGAQGVVLISRICEQNSTLTTLRYVDCESGALHWAVLAQDQPLDSVVNALIRQLGH